MPTSTHRRREVSRIEGFSDAVFGFAVTLLVVSLEVPKTFDELVTAMRGFPAFAVSFALLFMIWWRHYTFFRRYDLEDTFVVSMTGVLLFVVLFYVYPLKFLWTLVFAPVVGGVARATIHPRDAALLFEIYGAGVAASFGVLALLYRHAYARRAALDLTAAEAIETRFDVYRNTAIAGIGVVSAAAAIALLRVAPHLVGIAGFLYFGIGISEWTIGEYGGRLQRKLDT
jgi:uncharacterized membrane protein